MVGFPFLFGGAFIEAQRCPRGHARSHGHFPSFSEGLSLRQLRKATTQKLTRKFPFLFGGAFIEAIRERRGEALRDLFPFLFGGAFIEAGHRG